MAGDEYAKWKKARASYIDSRASNEQHMDRMMAECRDVQLKPVLQTLRSAWQIERDLVEVLEKRLARGAAKADSGVETEAAKAEFAALINQATRTYHRLHAFFMGFSGVAVIDLLMDSDQKKKQIAESKRAIAKARAILRRAKRPKA